MAKQTTSAVPAGGVFLRAVSGILEHLRGEWNADAKTWKPTGAATKFGAGHVFYHPNAGRAGRLIEMGMNARRQVVKPIVEKISDDDLVAYVQDALRGYQPDPNENPAESKTPRRAIAFGQLDKMVQLRYQELVDQGDAEPVDQVEAPTPTAPKAKKTAAPKAPKAAKGPKAPKGEAEDK